MTALSCYGLAMDGCEQGWQMSTLDWWVMGLYLAGMLLMAAYLGRKHTNKQDYFLAGQDMPNWALAHSIIATQCSSNSVLGAPAFVGFAVGGGLVWLQYELAVPLAMLWLCVLFVPIRKAGVISVYQVLEQRLGRESRLLASGCFLLFRGVATGVILYGVASVVAMLTGVSFAVAVALIMVITLVYDVLGGLRAVVISDVIQALLLLAAVLLGLIYLADLLVANWSQLEARAQPLSNDWGLQSGNTYGFWPMLFGGLFLYVAYYGCDQSQAQRLLASRSVAATQKVLMLNGLMRFPLVLSYCLLGLGLAAYQLEHPQFISQLPLTAAGAPNINLAFPAFVLQQFPAGVVGLVMVGLLAAAMSSIDSALNSLSACTLEDFLGPQLSLSEQQWYRLARVVTLLWGLLVVGFSFQVEQIAPTVLEAINKIGSMANGPLLALFVLALWRPSVGQRAAIIGFALGLVTNLMVSLWLPGVSWLWWNPIGFVASITAALLAAFLLALRLGEKAEPPAVNQTNVQNTIMQNNEAGQMPQKAVVLPLLAMTLFILSVCAALQWAL